MSEQRESEKFHQWMLDMRGIHPYEHACKTCSGLGQRAYGSTSTWQGGIGGQAITTDVCDKCWGSGHMYKPGANLRELYSELRHLRKQAKKAGE